MMKAFIIGIAVGIAGMFAWERRESLAAGTKKLVAKGKDVFASKK